MARPGGGVLGKLVEPSRTRASGIWSMAEIADASAAGTWPKGNVKTFVGNFTKINVGGNQDIDISGHAGLPDLTTLSAGSWALIFWSGGSTAASGTWTAQAGSSVGFVANGGGTISEFAIATSSQDGISTANTGRRLAAKAITIDWVGVNSDEANFVGFQTATSMRLNWTSNGNAWSNKIFNYMLVTGLTNAKVVNWQSPTVVGNKQVPCGFSPDLVMHATDFHTATGTTIEAIFGFGVMNKHGQQWANAFSAVDANTANTSRLQQTDACYVVVTDAEVLREQAHFVSMDSDGFTTHFSTVSGAARQVISLCMDGVASKIGAFTNENAATQTVSTRHGFAPVGALFSHTANVPDDTPASYAWWGMGASDGTNHRVATQADDDAVTTTQADSVWANDAAILTPINFGADHATSTKGYPSSLGTDDIALAWPTPNTAGTEHLYLLLGTGVDTFPSLMHTTSQSTATAYSHQKTGTTLSTGRMVTALKTSNFTFFKWSDDGDTWTFYNAGGDIEGWSGSASNGSIAAYVDSGGTERLVAVWKQSGTGGGRTNGSNYVMIGTFDADRTTLTWGTAVSITGTVDTGYNYLDLVVTAEGTGGAAHVIGTYISGSNACYHWRINIDSAGAITNAGSFYQTQFGPLAGSNGSSPSIDIDPITKRLFLAWSAGTTGAGNGIRFRTASYSAGAWTWADEVEVATDRYVDIPGTRWINCLWDGTRVNIAGWFTNGSNSVVRLYSSTNFTSFGTPLVDEVSTTVSRLNGGSAAADPNGNIYFVGAQNSPGPFDIVYRKFDRVAGTFGAAVITDYDIGSESVSGAANAWYSDGKINFVYTHGNNSPYTVKYDRILTGV